MPDKSHITSYISQVARKRLVFIAISTFLLIAAIHLSLITYHLSPASAQESPLGLAKSDYTSQLTNFNLAKNAYITAKSSYSQFGTATAKAEAYVKTRDYLLAADKLLVSYLTLVAEYGNETKWQSTRFDKAAIDKLILEQTTFIQNHQHKLQDTQTLEELPPLAQELKTQLDKSTRPKISKLIIGYDIAQTQSIFESFKDLSQFLNDFVGQRITAENHTFLVNWQSEINDIREKTETNLSLSFESYQKIREDYLNITQIKQTQTILDRAKTELKRSKLLFGEMTKIL